MSDELTELREKVEAQARQLAHHHEEMKALKYHLEITRANSQRAYEHLGNMGLEVPMSYDATKRPVPVCDYCQGPHTTNTHSLFPCWHCGGNHDPRLHDIPKEEASP